MYVPMPFPVCTTCGKHSIQGYHKGCGGKLEIDPVKNIVRCPKCNDLWDIWETTYFCQCGNKFTSHDIGVAVKEMLDMCLLAMNEIENIKKQKSSQKKMADTSIRNFLTSFFKKIGYTTGIAVGIIIEAVLKFFA